MSEEAVQAMAEGLERAMEAEHEGYHFYLMAAKTTEDPQGKEVFQRLAQDERLHYNFLKAQHKALLETGHIDADVVLDEPPPFDDSHPIFSKALKERVDQAHFELTAVTIGAQLELNAVKYYKRQAVAATDPEVEAFYNRLAEWESTHYHALLKEQEALKADFWADASFAPF